MKSAARPVPQASHYKGGGMRGAGEEVGGGVGWEGQEKRWVGLWDGRGRRRGGQGCGVHCAPLHKGQRESSALLTLCRKLLWEQYAARSWERVERRRRGEVSSLPPLLEERCVRVCWERGRQSPGWLPPCAGSWGTCICPGDDPAHSVWGDNRQELSLHSLFHVTWP